MNPKEPPPSTEPAVQQSAQPGKPYTPPAILHEMRLETRAGSLLGADPVETIFGVNTK